MSESESQSTNLWLIKIEHLSCVCAKNLEMFQMKQACETGAAKVNKVMDCDLLGKESNHQHTVLYYIVLIAYLRVLFRKNIQMYWTIAISYI